MAMKKACCCLSTRMGTLLFLYIFLINNVWSFLDLLISFSDSMLTEFLKDNPSIFYTCLFVWSIGGLIFLVAIISITNDTPSKSWLHASMVFLFLSVIHSVYVAYQITYNGALDSVIDAELEEKAKQLPSYKQDEFRAMMKKSIQSFLFVYFFFTTVIYALIVIYALLVFHGYIAELKRNQINGASARRNIVDREANLPGPSTNPQFTVQYSAQPHPYSPTAPQYYVMPSKR